MIGRVALFWTGQHGAHRASSIAELQDRCERFWFDRDPWLHAGRTRIRGPLRGTLHKRRPRTERRKADSIVLQMLVGRMDIHNLEVRNLPVRRMAQLTKMSVDSVKGVLRDLESCGYMERRRRFEQKPEGKRARPSVRWFTWHFFEYALQVTQEWFGRLRVILPRPEEPIDPHHPKTRFVSQLSKRKRFKRWQL